MTAALKYFEDFPVGERRELGSHAVTEEAILRFAREFDPQTFHVDRAAGEASIFGGLIASGWHTCAMTMRAICDGFLLEAASIGSPGIDTLRWKRPVRPGDTLHVYATIVEARPSTSKPDRGVLVNDIDVRNQHDEVVLTMQAMTMLYRRPPTPA
ncbi:MAG: MaoC family dehydratase [Vulcanimicrobiaceae bacterium]